VHGQTIPQWQRSPEDQARAPATHKDKQMEPLSAPTETQEHRVPTGAVRRRRPRRGGRRLPAWVRYVLPFAVFAAVLLGGQLAIHAYRTDPRDALALTQRELKLTVLGRDEHVYGVVPAFHRTAVNYFRATRGILVLTNRRMVFLGLVPRDLVGSPDAPAAFEQRDYPIDTLVRIHRGYAPMSLTRALTIDTPNGDMKLAVPTNAWSRAVSLKRVFDWQHETLFEEGRRQGGLRNAVAAARRAADAERRRPWYHVVRAREALSTIAALYDTTPEQLRALNGIVGDRIKAGQRLMVKPAT
jgi:LysM domain